MGFGNDWYEVSNFVWITEVSEIITVLRVMLHFGWTQFMYYGPKVLTDQDFYSI